MMMAEGCLLANGTGLYYEGCTTMVQYQGLTSPKDQELLHHQGGVDETHHTQPLHFCTSKQPFQLFSDLISQT